MSKVGYTWNIDAKDMVRGTMAVRYLPDTESLVYRAITLIIPIPLVDEKIIDYVKKYAPFEIWERPAGSVFMTLEPDTWGIVKPVA